MKAVVSLFCHCSISFIMTGCLLTQARADDQGSDNIQAAYVLYGQSTDLTLTPMARVILSGVNQRCPQLLSDVVKGPSINMSPRSNPDPQNFPVTVCEALYPFGKNMRVATSQVSLPAVSKDITTINVFGDTGCKSSDQSCQLNSQNWPFPALSAAAATATVQPDVILHMGDYNYSGTPGTVSITGLGNVQVYDAGDNTTQGLCQIPGGYYGQNTAGSQFPDAWQHWQSDFFAAAQPLFSVAPWVFARGNHELCSRAGPGWFYFLDASSSLLGDYQQQLSCPATTNASPEVLSPPFLLDFNNFNVVVVDAANACDYGLLHTDDYLNQFALVDGLINAADDNDQTWLQMHRPMWGVDKLDAGGSCGKSSGKHCVVNQTMQNAIQSFPLNGNIGLVVSGHMHRFQVIDFKSQKHPDQLVVGNSGVKLSGLHPKKTIKMVIGDKKATVMGAKEFGYMSITLDGQGWQGGLINPLLAQPQLFQCDSQSLPICQQVND